MKRFLRRSLLRSSLLAALGYVAALGPVQAQYTNLHSFAGGTNDGDNPTDSLILSGTTLYGMTEGGGAYDLGVVFQINTDGSGFAILHSFYGNGFHPADGSSPIGSLILSGTGLYGMTSQGGSFSNGVVFVINTNGTNYAILHNFAASPTNGASPYGSLTLSGTTLYGTTEGGGSNGLGVVFQINTNGSGFAILHTFTGIDFFDGANPYGSLTLSGTTLYGMTEGGGVGNGFEIGTVFHINTNGTGYADMYGFKGIAYGDGQNPNDSLTLSGPNFCGATLYGLTPRGGTSTNGVIFAIGTNGFEDCYEILYSFAGGTNDGDSPYGSLTSIGTTLYGMTYNGGTSSDGVVFQINTDGTGYTVLYDFLGAGGTYYVYDGVPLHGTLTASVTMSGTTLYGMTPSGGTFSNGVVFALKLSETNFVTITTPSPLPAGTVGTAYNQTLSATGGMMTYTWTVVSNNLPMGLSLVAGSGAITGTPTMVTTADFTVQALDASGLSAMQPFSLTINPMPTRIIGLAGSESFGNVPVGTNALQTLAITNSGNAALDVYSIVYPTGFSGEWSGSVPAGGSQNVTVTFAPTAATNYDGTLMVNDD